MVSQIRQKLEIHVLGISLSESPVCQKYSVIPGEWVWMQLPTALLSDLARPNTVSAANVAQSLLILVHPTADDMARGLSPATIVPTASDDCGESAASISDDEDGGGYSSEGSVAKAAVASAVQLGSAKYLQAAFNSQAASSQSESSEHHEAIEDGQETEVSALPKAHESEEQHKAIPPLIGKSLRQRSQSAVIQKQNGVELTKNYLELVRDFRQLRPYTRRPDGKYPSDTLCVYCVHERPTSVFFPCQHMCVCNDCIEANNITTDYSSPSDWR